MPPTKTNGGIRIAHGEETRPKTETTIRTTVP